MMSITGRMSAAVLAPTLLVAAGVVATPAQAVKDSETTIKDIAMQCYGSKHFGARPLVDLAGTDVSKAFEDMVTCGTMRKLTGKTINKSGEKGATVKYQGYRCEAAKVKDTQPTGGKTKWLCEFNAADTATAIYLKFWQYAD